MVASIWRLSSRMVSTIAFELVYGAFLPKKFSDKSRLAYNGGFKEIVMPTYIIMSKWTSRGLENLKQSPNRLDAARKAYQAVGIKMSAFFMTTGRYDMVAVVEAPDDVTFAKALLANASQGSFTTETCRAFTEDEYRQIIAGLA